MKSVHTRTLAAVTIGAIGLLGLAGCAATEATAPAKSQVATAKPAETAKPTETAQPAGGASSAGSQAEWANPVSTPGEIISSYSIGDVSVEIYQVAIAPAISRGSFVDPDLKPIIEVGDDIVLINYVVTNNGAPIDLGPLFVGIDARYDDWPYAGGMDTIIDHDLYAANGVNEYVLGPDGYNENDVYTFATGTSYSVGRNFRHQANAPITFITSITPVDAAGELLHDSRVEVTGTGTIK